MSRDVPSDPDLDFSDVPDTATGVEPQRLTSHMLRVLHGLGRWARRMAAARRGEAEERRSDARERRAIAAAMLLSILGGIVYIGGRLERLDAVARRVDVLEERIYQARGGRADTVTRASEEEP